MKRLKSVKQISSEYGISESILYSQIKTDPTFPVVNIGKKKKYLIDSISYIRWLKSRTLSSSILSAEELIRRFK